jgi:hypothetical protein
MTQPGEHAAKRHRERRDLGRVVFEHIDRTLELRRAPRGTWRARAEDRAKRGGTRVWRALKKRPSVGVVALGGLTIAAASAVGVGELTLGITAGYAAWQVLRKGKSVGEVIEEAERIGKV